MKRIDKDYGELGEAISKLRAREPAVHRNAKDGFDKVMKTAFSTFDDVILKKKKKAPLGKVQDYILQQDKLGEEETEQLDFIPSEFQESDSISFVEPLDGDQPPPSVVYSNAEDSSLLGTKTDNMQMALPVNQSYFHDEKTESAVWQMSYDSQQEPIKITTDEMGELFPKEHQQYLEMTDEDQKIVMKQAIELIMDKKRYEFMMEENQKTPSKSSQFNSDRKQDITAKTVQNHGFNAEIEETLPLDESLNMRSSEVASPDRRESQKFGQHLVS